MDEKERCQSCGMPLGVGFFGTNLDGSINQEYCKYCFEKGNFREPKLTLEEMMGRSAAFMIDELNMGRNEAEILARKLIPTLKRWTQN